MRSDRANLLFQLDRERAHEPVRAEREAIFARACEHTERRERAQHAERSGR